MKKTKFLLVLVALLSLGAQLGDLAVAQQAGTFAGVDHPWSSRFVQPRGGEATYVRVTHVEDGGLLAATLATVDRISPNGAVVAHYEGDRVTLEPNGRAFAVLDGRVLTVRDADGTALYSVRTAAPDSYQKLFPDGRFVFEGLVEWPTHDVVQVVGAKIHDDTGALRSQLATPDLRSSRLTHDHLLYTTSEALRKVDLDSQLVWSTPVQLQRFEASLDAVTRVIAVERFKDSRILHLVEDEIVASFEVAGPVWNLAIAPDGSWSAANTARGVTVFADGVPVATTTLPVRYVKRLAVSGRGEVLLGSSGLADDTRLLLLAPQGQLLWQTELAADRNAWRPAVTFHSSGDRFAVVGRDGVLIHDIERKP